MGKRRGDGDTTARHHYKNGCQDCWIKKSLPVNGCDKQGDALYKTKNGVCYGKFVLQQFFRFQFPAAEQQGEEVQGRAPEAKIVQTENAVFGHSPSSRT